MEVFKAIRCNRCSELLDFNSNNKPLISTSHVGCNRNGTWVSVGLTDHLSNADLYISAPVSSVQLQITDGTQKTISNAGDDTAGEAQTKLGRGRGRGRGRGGGGDGSNRGGPGQSLDDRVSHPTNRDRSKSPNREVVPFRNRQNDQGPLASGKPDPGHQGWTLDGKKYIYNGQSYWPTSWHYMKYMKPGFSVTERYFDPWLSYRKRNHAYQIPRALELPHILEPHPIYGPLWEKQQAQMATAANAPQLAIEQKPEVQKGRLKKSNPQKSTGNISNSQMLRWILYRAQTNRGVNWQANPAARIFPTTSLADHPVVPDVNLTVDTLDDLLSNNAPSDQDAQLATDPMFQNSLVDQARMGEEYEIDVTLDQAESQPGDAQVADHSKMDTSAEFSTAQPATPAGKASENCCLETPRLWRSFSYESNERTLWAKEQVLNRIPNYIKLYNIETKSGSDWLSPEMVAESFSKIQPREGSREQLQLLLLQGQTYVITRTFKKLVPGVFTVLNMASEARPGGHLFENSLQQEESLCMQGDLYQRLLQLRGGTYPLKPGELIITEDSVVCFSNGHIALPPAQNFYTHVISMPAPICPRDMTADGYATSRCGIQMRRNIKTLMDAADVLLTNVLVLSAWGCGVYRNPTAEVARMFRAELSSRDWTRSRITHVIFAIYDKEKGRPAWRPFMNVFHDAVPGFEASVIDRLGVLGAKFWLDQVSTLT